MSDAIKRISIEGFKSIRRLENFELRGLNVLIGANGAGKSNFVDFLRVLRELANQRLQTTIGQAGGVDAFLHLGPKITRQIVGKIAFDDNNGYEFALVPTHDNRFLFETETVVVIDWLANPDRTSGPSERVSLGSGHREAGLGSSGSLEAQRIDVRMVQGMLSNILVYHFHDTSATAGVRRQIAINQNDYFYADGSNLAAFLYRMVYENPVCYQRIRDVVRLAAPFFADFQLRPNPLVTAMIQLEWRQNDSDHPFLASQLSDGTLRFICLATVLLQPKPPAVMVFDEPELGLHPHALKLLASLLQQASTRTSHQVIVSTQSAQLVNEFEPEDIIVVERTQGESVFRRLETATLSGWLEDYSLGELWQKNVFGGGPRSETVPIPPDGEGGSADIPEGGKIAGDGRS